MSGDNYLVEYDKAVSADLSRGIGGVLRSKLDRYAQAQGQNDRHALFLPRVLDMSGITLDSPKTVLEVGCGNGWAISYKHKNLKYVAVDLGSFYKKSLEKRGIEFHQTNVATEPLTISDGTVNLVILNHLIEHIEQTEFFIGQIARVLSAGGILYIRTPNIEKVKWKFYHDCTHVRPFSIDGLQQLMSVFGFEKQYVLYSDHARINVDIATNGAFRAPIFSKLLGGKEIEAAYVKRLEG